MMGFLIFPGLCPCFFKAFAFAVFPSYHTFSYICHYNSTYIAARSVITHFLTKWVLTRILKDEEKMYVFIIEDVRKMYGRIFEDVYRKIKDEEDRKSILQLTHKMPAVWKISSLL